MNHSAVSSSLLDHYNEAAPPALAGIRSRRVLTAAGFCNAQIGFDGALINDIAATAGSDNVNDATHFLDVGNMLVLPGIVDLHGDAFERAVMPRPGVSFEYDHALLDVDRQLLANGITTAFHGVTVSWEGGLRGAPYAQRMFDSLERNAAIMGAQHRVHLRFETHNVDDVALACEWIKAGKIGFLALNNHLPGMAKRGRNDSKLLQYADRAECDLETFSNRIHAALAATDRVGPAMRTLLRCALDAGLRVASHDDRDAAERQAFDELGCSVAEFPLTLDAVQAAHRLGNMTVFGAPNVVRGGSHNGALDATKMVRDGLCDVLASDYYYPAQLTAAFKLDTIGAMPLARAWQLTSRNPADAAGLDDRGELSVGRRADAIVVDDSKPGLPRVCAAIVGGRLQFANRHWPMTSPSREAVSEAVAP